MLNDVKILPFAKIIPAAAKIAVSVHINENPNHTVMTIFGKHEGCKDPFKDDSICRILKRADEYRFKAVAKEGDDSLKSHAIFSDSANSGLLE